MKLLGCIFIISACSLFGFFKALSLKLRCRNLLEFKMVLESLKIRVGFLKENLAEALISASKNHTVFRLFHTFAENLTVLGTDEAWEKSLEKNSSTLHFTDEDTEVLKKFSNELGKTDSKNQIKHIDFILELVAELYLKADDDLKNKYTVYKSMGAVIGSFLVLLLI